MKQILIVKDALAPWSKGGGEDRYFLLSSLFSEQKMRIKFASMKWWDGENPKNHIALAKLVPLYCKNGTRSKFQAIYFALSTFKILWLKPDLIEADQAPILQVIPLWIVSRLLRIPFSCTVHEYWGREYWVNNYGIIGHVGSRIENLVLKLPDVVIVPSTLTAARISKATKELVSPIIIPNEILLPPKEKISTKLREADILYVGRLIEHKRVDLVISTFEVLLKKFPTLHLGIVGIGPDFEILNQQAERTLPTKSYTFFGSLEKKMDVLGLMLKCKIFISPSEREGFGISVLEALELGRPSLISSSKDNASTEFIDQYSNLYIVDEQSPIAYAEIAKGILENSTAVIAGKPILREKNLATRYVEVWEGLL